MFGKALIDLRKLYDANEIDDEQFTEAVNEVYAALTKAPVELKVAVFDAVAECFASGWEITELEDGVAWEDDDSQYYIYETFVTALFGNDIYAKFKNKTYQSG